jgi:hypothetical protein
MTNACTLQNAQFCRHIPDPEFRSSAFLSSRIKFVLALLVAIVRIRTFMPRYLKLEVRLHFGFVFFHENPRRDLQRSRTIWLRLRRAATGRTK